MGLNGRKISLRLRIRWRTTDADDSCVEEGKLIGCVAHKSTLPVDLLCPTLGKCQVEYGTCNTECVPSDGEKAQEHVGQMRNRACQLSKARQRQIFRNFLSPCPIFLVLSAASHVRESNAKSYGMIMGAAWMCGLILAASFPKTTVPVLDAVSPSHPSFCQLERDGASGASGGKNGDQRTQNGDDMTRDSDF